VCVCVCVCVLLLCVCVCVTVCVCVYDREAKLAGEREAKRLILAAKRVQRGIKFSKVLS
jgi:hypothetical protein